MAIFYVKQKSVCNPVVLSLSLFQKGKQKVTYVIANYESAEANVRKIEKDLQRHQQVLTKDVYVFSGAKLVQAE